MTPKISRYSRGDGDADLVLVLVPIKPRDEGFAEAKKHLDRGRKVRLVGQGVTLERTWPAWVKDAKGLTLTEWGALQNDDRGITNAELNADVEAWLDRVFGGRTPGKVFFGNVCTRFFFHLMEWFPIALGLARAFPTEQLVFLGDEGRLAPVVEQLRGKEATHVSRLARAAWAAKVGLAGAAGIALSCARQVSAYLKARPSFDRLRELNESSASPRSWVVMMPDWYRINHQLIDAFAMPELEATGSLGVLLIGSLEPGARTEGDLTQRTGTDLWPGLGKLRDLLDRCAVDQVVMPERPLDFARACLDAARTSVTAVTHVARTPVPAVGSLRMDLRGELRHLIGLITQDVLRATMARAATEAVVRRRSMQGTTVLFSCANIPEASIADLALQQAGARTVDHQHGGVSDWYVMGGWGCSTLTSTWTRIDARTAERTGRRPLLAGMPVRLRLPARRRAPKHVLILSSYVHRDWRAGSYHTKEPFQYEMLDLVPRLRARFPDLLFRWRPHPADSDDAIAAAHKQYEGLELSRGQPLATDAEWADLAVSNLSTAVLELLFVDIPLFLHMWPDLDGISASSYIAPERRFFRSEEGAAKIGDFLAACEGGVDLSHERAARELLFGPSGEPVPMTEALFPRLHAVNGARRITTG